MKNIQLVIIDPQCDFCDPNGSLFVPGADEDCKRLAAFIDRLSPKFADIHVTLDSHRTVDIAHPIFWVNSDGEHPRDVVQVLTAGDPFDEALITAQKLRDGVWRTTNPAWMQQFPDKTYGAIDYVNQLEANGRYPLTIWPYHCRIGTWGHSIVPCVADALIRWEQKQFGLVDFITKGSNPFTEHYSAVKADVEDPSDPTTLLNAEFLDILSKADEIPLSGQALSHCVANTGRDIADNFGESNIRKLKLLTDACSNVMGCEDLGNGFVADMKARGMGVSTTVEYLAEPVAT